MKDTAAAEKLSKLSQLGSDEGPELGNSGTPDSDDDLSETIQYREEEADRLIDDKLASLTWEEMQELVAELLRSSCPSRNRANLLPSLAIDPSRSFVFPELRLLGVSPK